ncbi:hypothetical protein TeGR_g7418 [Tetraparma gracilis]|uniref:Uncharacterized protein n=1 Tax=Tetraparma gracilis TaxID=2962635 RepID=A0ABQ6M4L8_9STRA|nr:hypothetical protein TeGR_g7418 [Tetraparma gracilis]
MRSASLCLLLLPAISAFTAPASPPLPSSLSAVSDMKPRMWDKMVDASQRSKAVPFLPRAINLDGSMVGDVGFDPFYLSSIEKNWAGLVQPPQWEDQGPGISNLYWMREAELKHGRMAMLAWTGWLAADGALGVGSFRFPGAAYQAVPSSYEAHDIMVAQGSMGFFLLAMAVAEVTMASVFVQVAKGESDREPGDWKLDPLRILDGKPQAYKDDMRLKELKNGRLAMLAFAGVVTQAQIGHTTFPYI